MRKYKVIIYGSYGYTGELIAEECLTENISVLLSGRNEVRLKTQSEKTGYPYKAVDINDPTALLNLLKDGDVLINAAGPFINTASLTVEACIDTKTHYLDINGDVKVFELIRSYSEKANDAGIMLMPGVGFDVVPTDCMALKLKNRMPDAIELKLAFATIGGGISHGTATTVAGRLGEPAVRRENGELIPVPLGKNGMWVDFGEKRMFVMSIPWGDVSTAFVTTGIPNIESFMAVKPKIYRLLKFQGLVNWLLRTEFIRSMVLKKIDSRPAGPTLEERKRSHALIWGEAKNKDGKTITASMRTPESYTLTAISTVHIAKKVLNVEFKKGYQTPAGVYGESLVEEVGGVVL